MIPETGCGQKGCPAGFTCDATYGGYYDDQASFSHFGKTALVFLQMCTLSDWQVYSNQMRMNLGETTVLFSFVIIVYLAFFALNLFAGVIVFTFRQAQA